MIGDEGDKIVLTDIVYNVNVMAPRVDPAPSRDPLAFHRRLPGYAPTPLVEAPMLARELGVGKVWVKDESSRLGLPSFKMLGASWAIYRALAAVLGEDIAAWQTLDDLRARIAPSRPLTLVAATDGNHGRAVARMARLLDLAAHIFVPADMAPVRVQAIEGEGARITVVDGTYDEAVARSAWEADERHLVISDTSWPGYADVPRWVVEGYSTIFWELDDEWARRGEAGPHIVVVPIGVGSLAAAVVRHYRRPESSARATIVGVEPRHAACVLASIRAGRRIAIPGPHDSVMAGLNCGAPSLVAWPLLSAGLDLVVAIDDDQARRAMRDLAGAGVVAGETGAAALGGLTALLTDAGHAAIRARLGIDAATRVLILSTEGATDPAAYERIVGHSPHDIGRLPYGT